jgi:SAM-dependent methyltransferase
MSSRLEQLLHARRLTGLLDASAGLGVLRAGLRAGLFEALREPVTDDELATRLGVAADLLAAWLRAAEAQGFVRRHDARLELSPFTRWLLGTPEAPALRALLDQAALGWGPRFEELPQLLRGAERPLYGASAEEGPRMATAWRFLEERAVRALGRIPGVRNARRVLDVGCGYGTMLAAFLSRYRDAQGVGVERDLFVAEAARRELREAGVERRGEIVAGDFMTTELNRGSFDLILIDNSLHYFAPAQHAALFRRVLAHLSPGGVLALQTIVVSGDALGRILGGGGLAASFDLYLRCHRNLYGLPDLDRVRAELRDAGFSTTGEVAVLPGGISRYVWARTG